ncbi:MAG: alpha/beta fold hydrolase [Deltaproteobacteria bacterium]|nr:alpha/beta fold hydrolase [Deltaproteobacteria bacterium]
MSKRALVLLLLVAASGCVRPGPHGTSAPREDMVKVGGAWLRVRDLGPRESGRVPVLLLHGYGSRLEAWAPVQEALAAERRVVAFDQRGFGFSERPEGEYGPEAHARDALALMDALGLERVVVAGHSYGGGVALRLALDAPERVEGLLLVSTFALEEQIPESFRWAQVAGLGELIFGAFYKQVPGEKSLLAFHDRDRFVTLEALDEMRAMMARPGSTYAALETVRGMRYTEAEERYGALKVPVRVVWGRDDRALPLAQGRRLAGRLSVPLDVIEDCGHLPLFEQPASVVRVARELLGEVEP